MVRRPATRVGGGGGLDAGEQTTNPQHRERRGFFPRAESARISWPPLSPRLLFFFQVKPHARRCLSCASRDKAEPKGGVATRTRCVASLELTHRKPPNGGESVHRQRAPSSCMSRDKECRFLRSRPASTVSSRLASHAVWCLAWVYLASPILAPAYFVLIHAHTSTSEGTRFHVEIVNFYRRLDTSPSPPTAPVTTAKGNNTTGFLGMEMCRGPSWQSLSHAGICLELLPEGPRCIPRCHPPFMRMFLVFTFGEWGGAQVICVCVCVCVRQTPVCTRRRGLHIMPLSRCSLRGVAHGTVIAFLFWHDSVHIPFSHRCTHI